MLTDSIVLLVQCMLKKHKGWLCNAIMLSVSSNNLFDFICGHCDCVYCLWVLISMSTTPGTY